MAEANSGLTATLDRVDADLDSSLERLFALLRVPSISTDPAFADDCARAADLLVDELAELGFSARSEQTPGHPIVIAQIDGPGPHVIFYGHYDVQPPDPLDQWRHGPFEPVIEERADGARQIVARGVADNKGQMRTFLEACRAWKAVHGSLPCRMTLVLEGEEESGSQSLAPFLQDHAEELSADFALICDTMGWDSDTPGITIGLRGGVFGELTLQGPSCDLHSGLYGGAARNPIQVLAGIIHGMRDSTGRVTLPGFYEGVPEITHEVRQSWEALGFDAGRYLGDVGLSVPAGESGYSVLEQIWARPTFDVNGIVGGYTGVGTKSIVPAEASAKVSFRLVGTQDPDAIWDSFAAYVEASLPADCTASLTKYEPTAPAFNMAGDSGAIASVRESLDEEWGQSALLGCGGGIPVVNTFREVLGLDSIMVGFALDDDRIHSPNEKYDLKCFHKGTRSWVRILAALSEKD